MKDDYIFQIVKAEGLEPISIDEISHLPISIKPLYMCKFGCKEYGNYPSCPPYTGTYEDIVRFWQSYSRFVLVTTQDEFDEDFDMYKRNFQYKLINIQRKLRDMGFYYVFPLFPGSCRLCKVCGMPHECYRPQDVRPSVSAMGVELISYLQERTSEIDKVNIYLHTRRLFSIILLE
ncbi:MAG: hypothetical protein GXO59_04705 [Dictyoglomi bacterium]|nr:hypothetical protein [Dictyoglomota bacterium]